MFALCQSKFNCGFASMLENQRPPLPPIFVIPADAENQACFYNALISPKTEL